MSKIREIQEKKSKVIKAGQNVMSRKLAAYWKEQVKFNDEKWAGFIRRGNAINKRYRDSRSKQDSDSARRMNVLWTNVQIMKPAIYSKCPIVNVERKFLDRDPIGRLSAQILERGARNEVSLGTTHASIEQAVLDYLLPGLGQVWARYQPEFGQGDSMPSQSTTSSEDGLEDILEEFGDEDDSAETEQLESTEDQVIAEKAPLDYIDWKDFYMFPARARTWAEVQAVGKQVWASRQECIEFFGEEIGSKILPDPSYKSSSGNFAPYSDTAIFQEQNDRDRKIFEIWNKTDKRAYWCSTGYDYLCKVENDPLKLANFFPCPKPLFATWTNDSVEPVADYTEWQDQAMQIDELTQRIALLSQACRVAGTYDSSNGSLKRILDEGGENKLYPVDSWAAHAEKGGVSGGISFLPLKEIMQTIETLTAVRQQVKQDLDEVTGLSDVLRGTTDSRETLGGLRLKNNNAGTRLSDRQNKVAEFAREAIALQAEIMAKHFSEQSLIDTSGIMFEDELDPKTVYMDLMQDEDIQQAIQQKIQQQMQVAQQQMMQHMQMMQQPQQSPIGGNVVPFGQPSSQTQPQAPQPNQQMQQQMQKQLQQYQQQLQQQALAQLKQMVPDYIQKKIQAAIDLLRKDIPFRYRIEIETDSTIFADAMQERQDATEFIKGLTDFMSMAGEIGMTQPEAAPVLGKALMWTVRKFRTGRDLESAIDTYCKQMEKKAKQAMDNPQPNPEVQKQQLELQKIKQEQDAQRENDQRDAARQEAEDQRDAAMQKADDERKAALENAKTQMEIRKALLDYQLETARIDQEYQQMALENKYAEEEHERSMKELTAKTDASIKIAKAKPKQQAAQAKKKGKK